MFIPLTKYAERRGIKPNTARARAEAGRYKTAKKLGRDWVIDENDEYIDGRKTRFGITTETEDLDDEDDGLDGVFER